LFGLVKKWLFLVIVFPLLIGLGEGGACLVGIRVGKLRHPALACVLGIFGGILTMFFVHFFFFLFFRNAIAPGTAFARFLNDLASVGVTISRTTGGGSGMNLGYVGTWIYWIVEVLIVAGVSGAFCWIWARRPFCTRCNTWKTSRVLGTVQPP